MIPDDDASGRAVTDGLLNEVDPITAPEALQFALILSSGMPHLEALEYLRPALGTNELKRELSRWMGHPTVQAAILKVQGKPWQDMALPERIEFSINKHYTELAYFLYRNNYNDLDGSQRSKADICRQTLEAKLAGMAGKLDALSQFWSDVQSGKVKLQPTVQ